MNRVLIAVAAAFLVVACAAGGPRWLGDDLREVDGLVLDVIRECSGGPDPVCRAALDASRGVLAERGGALTKAAIGSVPRGWTDGVRSYIDTYAGLSRPRIVVLEFADGSVETVILGCESQITDSAGLVVKQAVCYETQFAWPARADEPPWASPAGPRG